MKNPELFQQAEKIYDDKEADVDEVAAAQKKELDMLEKDVRKEQLTVVRKDAVPETTEKPVLKEFPASVVKMTPAYLAETNYDNQDAAMQREIERDLAVATLKHYTLSKIAPEGHDASTSSTTAA